ncbi:hypothetical protein HIM_09802 [Hirsutella minnesotensis 3608]|uniref:DDE-1 domain-containing protein n=1 Tax=Hirsutella minnesotensis 3608 TaxID=1043627 RepID=A0A0F8A2W5_9HYPO|nr:hypothetical protein HIM_09802 [Hirsutella minnesotensis 3608]
MDETGFRIGVGKDQLIVTKRARAHYFGIPENREFATAIEAMSANGEVIPAFLILAAQMHMASWYQIPELDQETVIRPTPTAFRQALCKKLQKLEAFAAPRRPWFSSHEAVHPVLRRERHHPLRHAADLTHVLQPLDVVVFQPLKHYHAKALDVMVRDGLVNITKLEFLSCIQDVRMKAFKKDTVRSAFRKTGVFPFDPQVVLRVLEARQAEKTPSPPSRSGPYSSPLETPLTLRQSTR